MIRRMEPCHLEQVAWLEQVCFSENWSYQLLEAGIHSPFDVYFVWEQGVRESNLAARKLYESFGFAAEAVRKGYYHNPLEDALIMWRRGLQS